MNAMFMNNNKGFTLLEAMIGFLILSVGMLGIASLQAISLKAGKTSVYTSVAMMKVEEIIESMAINSGGLAIYASAGAGSGTNHSCSTKNCDSVFLAQDDIFWWKKNLKAGLPGTDDTKTLITVIAPVAPSKMATVKVDISWKERDKDSSAGVSKTTSVTVHICTATPC